MEVGAHPQSLMEDHCIVAFKGFAVDPTTGEKLSKSRLKNTKSACFLDIADTGRGGGSDPRSLMGTPVLLH